jgi:hypothetical protein
VHISDTGLSQEVEDALLAVQAQAPNPSEESLAAATEAFLGASSLAGVPVSHLGFSASG